MSSLRFLKSDFIDFLSGFRFQCRFIEVRAEGERLSVVAKGPLVHVMGFEIFVLYIIDELYLRRLVQDGVLDVARARLQEQIATLKAGIAEFPVDTAFPFVMFDFGLRRRFSAAWHEEVVQTFVREVPHNFCGTSNVYLARKLGLMPIGTMAHEYLQAYQSFGFRLRNFDLYFAKLFDGSRHNSSDPMVWGEKAIAHYEMLRIDAVGKRLVFSDALNIPRALALYRHFHGRIQTSFGVGTDFSSDTPHQALNIVMKIVECNGQPVANLSDTPGKTLCENETFLAYLRQVFDHKS